MKRQRTPRLSAAQKQTRDRALETIANMRRYRLSLKNAAKQSGTTPATVRRYAGKALQKERGTYQVRRADRIPRRLLVMTTEGPAMVTLRGSRVASLVGEHWNAVSHFIDTGDDSALGKFTNKRVGGKNLETDLDRLEYWARRGEIDFPSIYEDIDDDD